MQAGIDHPVTVFCRRVISLTDAGTWMNADRERFVLDRGRPYTGIVRPKGYRQRARKQCFTNASRLALEDRGTYVEGFVTASGGPIHHAWITIDGQTAVDTTLPDAPARHYFGIAFNQAALLQMCKRGTYGMLEPFDIDFLRESLRG